MFLQELRSPQKIIVDINMVDEPDSEAELKLQKKSIWESSCSSSRSDQYCSVVVHVVEHEVDRLLYDVAQPGAVTVLQDNI